MSSEAVPELELLSIEEEKELLEDVEEEVNMLDVEELLAEEPEVQEGQDPPTLDTTIEPSPSDTTMEVDLDFGEIVGDLIDAATHGDKSPVESGPEVEMVDDNLLKGDKSPEIQIIEEPESDDKSSEEAEPDEIEILDQFGMNFTTSTPSPPKTPEYRTIPTPFNDPDPEVEFLGNVSRESNISIPRTPGTPKNKSKIKDTSGAVTKKVFGPSKGHKIRNKGKTEPNGDKIKERRVKNLPRREYGQIRDKFLPLDINDPIIASVSKSFARAVELSNRSASRASAGAETESSRGMIRPGDRCTGTIASIRANAQRNLPKSLIELGAKIKDVGTPSDTKKAQMPANLKQKLPEAQMPGNSAQMPEDPKTKAQMPDPSNVPPNNNKKAQMPESNNVPSDPKETPPQQQQQPQPQPRPLMEITVTPVPTSSHSFPTNPLKPRFEFIKKNRREVTEKRITVLLGGPLVKLWGQRNEHYLKVRPPGENPNSPPAEVKVLKFPETPTHPSPISCSDYLEKLMWSSEAKEALVHVVMGDLDLWTNMELRQQQQAIYKCAQIVSKKCASQHKHLRGKLCQVVFVTTPPPVNYFVPPSFGPNNFHLPHFSGNSKHSNLQWVERVAHNIFSTNKKIVKFAKMTHFRDSVRHADLTAVLPLQGKHVLDPYEWSPPWPRNQGDLSLDALKKDAKEEVLKIITKTFYNYKPVKSRPPRRS